MEKHVFDEKNGLRYTLGEDGLYYPDRKLLEEDKLPVGKFGQLQLKYLKHHKRAVYTTLLTSGKLTSYLVEIDHQAQEKCDQVIHQMAGKQGITEDFKAENSEMGNNIRGAVLQKMEAEGDNQ